MNKKNLAALVLSSVVGTAGCIQKESMAVGEVAYGFCVEDTYYLRLISAEIYLKENDEVVKDTEVSAYHPICSLFTPVPQGTLVKVIGNIKQTSNNKEGIIGDLGPHSSTEWKVLSFETYRVDLEKHELIYPWTDKNYQIDYP